MPDLLTAAMIAQLHESAAGPICPLQTPLEGLWWRIALTGLALAGLMALVSG